MSSVDFGDLRAMCNCSGHRVPGVSHLVACCDQPHVDWILPTPPPFESTEAADKWLEEHRA